MKLCILDKDGTIVTPASGETFVQSPEDQILLPNVKERIAQMKTDGWTFAIASNQGGCAIQTKTASELKAGQYLILEDKPYKILQIEGIPLEVLVILDRPRSNGKAFAYFQMNSHVQVQRIRGIPHPSIGWGGIATGR